MPKVKSDRLKSHRGSKAPLAPPKGITSPEPLLETTEKRALLAVLDPALPTGCLPPRDNPGIPQFESIKLESPISYIPTTFLPYSDFNRNERAHYQFHQNFFENSFGHTCGICDRLWFKNDLTKLPPPSNSVLRMLTEDLSDFDKMICKSCMHALRQNHLPALAKSNGFTYPVKPDDLPALNSISERLISPRIPFRHILLLRDEQDPSIISIPVSENNLVHHFPRRTIDDYCLYLNLDEKKLFGSNDLAGPIDKQALLLWLDHLVTTPLYQALWTTIDRRSLKSEKAEDTGRLIINDVSGMPNTVMWDADRFIKSINGNSQLDDELFSLQAEELCFPSVYLGQPRACTKLPNVTPSMMASSELRRSDRRGVTPDHLLYMALRTMRTRLHEASKIHFNTNNDPTRQKSQLEQDLDHSLQDSLPFLKSIPNSVWYWEERKQDLFAMIRQLGKPTLSLSLRANEIGWMDLLKILYKLKHNQVSEDLISNMCMEEKVSLANQDAVTCMVYFNKMVDVLMSVLQAEADNPFGDFRVLHTFQRIEFRNAQSPCMHLLLWLQNAPKQILGQDREKAIFLIDQVSSVSPVEASGQIEHQIHKHSSFCYRKHGDVGQTCQAPYMPSPFTMILKPLARAHPNYLKYSQIYKQMKIHIAHSDNSDVDKFYKAHGIKSHAHYMNILQAGISRPTVFLKRELSEKWNKPFNPFMLNVVQASMNIQLIPDEDSFLDYVEDYVGKTDWDGRELQNKIRAVFDANPKCRPPETIKKLWSADVNTVEITHQQAAWYLLDEPFVKSSSAIAFIQTVRPSARVSETAGMEESPDAWKDWFSLYEARPQCLEAITLAQFAAYYTHDFSQTTYVRQDIPRIIRYQKYDMQLAPNEFKREMVTLHVPFRDEQTEILDDMKFLERYAIHEKLILMHRMEFEWNLQIDNIVQIGNDCREEQLIDEEASESGGESGQVEVDPFLGIFDDGQFEKDETNVSTVGETSYAAVNIKIENPQELPFQIVSSSPVKCRKTFIVRVFMEVYNAYVRSDGLCHICYHLAAEEPARIETRGPLTYSAWKISATRMLSLDTESAEQYYDLFKHIQLLTIDQFPRFDEGDLCKIDTMLKRITGSSQLYGGIDIVLVGDAHTTGSQDPKGNLKVLELGTLMARSNHTFALLKKKMENNMHLTDSELQLLEARIFSGEEADRLCPNGIRLFSSQDAVDSYNESVLQSSENQIVAIAEDTYMDSTKIDISAMEEVRDLPLTQTSGLPYKLILVLNKIYMLTGPVEPAGLQVGSLGRLAHIDYKHSGEIDRLWLDVLHDDQRNSLSEEKSSRQRRASNVSRTAIPLSRLEVSISLPNSETPIVRRQNFPLVPAFAVSILQFQGRAFDEVVCEYNESQSHQLLTAALSQVRSVNKLYMVASNSNPTFHHSRKPMSGTLITEMINQSIKLSCDTRNFIASRAGLSVLIFKSDLGSKVGQKPGILVLLEPGSQNDVPVLPDFNCIVQFKRDDMEEDADFGRQLSDDADRTQMSTPHMMISLKKGTCMIAERKPVGEICAARCALDTKKVILNVCIYAADNPDIPALMAFIHEALLEYTIDGSILLGTYFCKIPIILTGNFNIDFNSRDAQPFIAFLDNSFGLKSHNLDVLGKSMFRTDAVFTRYLNMVPPIDFVFYIRYHERAEGKS